MHHIEWLAWMACVSLLMGCMAPYPDAPHTSERPPLLGSAALITACQTAVEHEVEQRYGWRSQVYFDTARFRLLSRLQAQVEGRARARLEQREYDFGYHCRLDRENGWVEDLRLDWQPEQGNGGYGEHPKAQAIRLCEREVRQRLGDELRQAHQWSLQERSTRQESHERLKIKGKAKIKTAAGKGRIAYRCVASLHPLSLDEVGYHWLESIAPPDSSGGQAAQDEAQAIELCFQAIEKQLHQAGYSRVYLRSSKIKQRKNPWQVRLDVRFHRGDAMGMQRYTCWVDLQAQRVIRLTPRLPAGTLTKEHKPTSSAKPISSGGH